jgi:molybdate transport system substrate-binding protein
MRQVLDDHAAARPQVFARNSLEIAVPPGNPGHVTGLADLARPKLRVAVCQVAVPCGALAESVLRRAHVPVRPVTEALDVKAVLTAVETGEVDAGLVYRTDVQAAGAKAVGIPIPAAANGSTSYPIAVLTASRQGTLAAAFVAEVLSPDGRAVLARAGFGAP